MGTDANVSSPLPPIAAAALLGATTSLIHHDRLGPTETLVFRRLNRSFGRLDRPIWAVMQYGNGLTALWAPVVLRAAKVSRRRSLQVGAAAGAAWFGAKAVKAAVRRGRPASLLDEVEILDHEPTGLGYVSGHAAVATAATLTAAGALPTPLLPVLLAATATVGLARVHVGAHLPLDVVGGVCVGVLCASTALNTDRIIHHPTAASVAAAGELNHRTRP
jgi:undecaprenyl-diphosphatase